MAGVFLTPVTYPEKLWELLAVLVCKSQQLSCGLFEEFWFEEDLIFVFFFLFSYFPPKAPEKIVLEKVTLLCPADVSALQLPRADA